MERIDSFCDNCKSYCTKKGECRFNPPVLVKSNNTYSSELYVSRWPYVKENDWCGKHERSC